MKYKITSVINRLPASLFPKKIVPLLFSAVITLINAAAAQSQSQLRWVRGGYSIPFDAVVGGEDRNGNTLYICRTVHRDVTLPGKVDGGKCSYNWGSVEYYSSTFDILIGDGEYWTETVNSRAAVVGGSNRTQIYYVCRAFESGGAHPGRLQNGKCNYGFAGRGYASSNYEILNGDSANNGAVVLSLLDAAGRGDAAGISAALSAGQAINQKNGKGQTALMLSALKGSSEAVRVLLNEGAAVDLRDEEGYTALMYAAYAGDPQSVRQLLRAGANLNARTNAGNTAFYFAAAGGNVETAQAIMNDRAFEGLRRAAGFPLHGAAAKGHTQMINFLIDTDELDIDAEDLNGQTALMRAARNNKSAAASLLLRAGADVTVIDNNNYDVFNLAAIGDAGDVLGVLLNSGKFKINSPQAVNGLLNASRYNKLAALKVLLQRGVNPNSTSSESNTALAWAASEGNDEAVKLLIAANANVDARNRRGETPLMLAAANSKRSSLKLLLKAGANINLQDAAGRTALRHAIDNDHKDTRKELEKAGAQ